MVRLSEVMQHALDVCRDEGMIVGFRGGYWHGARIVEQHGGNRPPWTSDNGFGTRTIQGLLDRGLVEPVSSARLRSGMPTAVQPVRPTHSDENSQSKG